MTTAVDCPCAAFVATLAGQLIAIGLVETTTFAVEVLLAAMKSVDVVVTVAMFETVVPLVIEALTVVSKVIVAVAFEDNCENVTVRALP